MNSSRPVGWLLPLMAFASFVFTIQSASAQKVRNEIRLIEMQGTVEISTDGGIRWVLTQTNQTLRPGDHLRTGANSRAALRASPATVLPFGELTEIEILKPDVQGAEPGVHIIKGILSFFHRDKPGRTRIVAPGAVAGVDGTEFVIAADSVNGQQRTTLAVIDGIVWIENAQGRLTLTNGERAIVELGGAPVRVAGFVVNNLLQWSFYYPAVLDTRDLELEANEQQELAESLRAYRAGDLLAALAALGGQEPASERGKLYKAALQLAVGSVQKTVDTLAQLEKPDSTERVRRLAAALRQQIAVVKGERAAKTTAPELPTELLAASYHEQSRGLGDDSLKRALALARQAATNSPEFGFAWARVAELEFSFGHTEKASDALAKSLAVSPRNAQAIALNGFILAARNHPRQAIASFDRALEIDAALANAWLGRGLCRIRIGDAAAGREDLLVAAALEPRRAQLRSYLGKSFGDAGDSKRALHELELAKDLDPRDPTALLYSALLKADDNRINEAIGDLEQAQQLNSNRSVFRSASLLDRDRAVQSANLARIYQDAGMDEWSLQEAGRAVSYDYANYSAHLFLANSYDRLRDPNRVNLRYESAAESEYLIANLLAPIGAGLLSQSVSQQEYSKLFERDGFGLTSFTEYLSRDAWRERAAQFGTFGNSSYLLEAFYRTDPGQRANNDFEEREFHFQFKQQITPKDLLYLRLVSYDACGGDVLQYFDQRSASRVFRQKEKQEPLVFAGLRHDWNEEMHTLLLAGRFDDTLSIDDPRQFVLIKSASEGEVTAVRPINMDQNYRDELELYSAELQQIWQTPFHHTVAGALFQWGHFRVQNLENRPSAFAGFFDDPAARQDVEPDFERISLYGYHTWAVASYFQIIGGVSYDHIASPKNFRFAPVSENENTVGRVSPKAGLVWTPAEATAVRAAYTRSLAGASLDQSFRLEPTQVGGFNQSFRSVIPESVAGANTAASIETYGISLEQKFPSRTYVTLAGELLNSKVHRAIGVFELDTDISDFAFPSHLREHLDYHERSLTLAVDQLLDTEWSVGARYRVTKVELESRFPDVRRTATVFAPFQRRQNAEALLHQLDLHIIYNHSSGFFSRFNALLNAQSNDGYAPAQPGDDFWQLNVFAGYRFFRRKAEVALGVLNLTDEDYRLNPLTLYNELPRERTFVARLRLSF